MRCFMRKDKNDKKQKPGMVILTKPETIFNNEVVRDLAKIQKKSCASVRKVMKTLLMVRKQLEEDRQGLFRLFIDTWRYAAANVGGLADTMMKNPCGIETEDQYIRSVTAPYCTIDNFVTGALIGEMSSAEELEFTITSSILSSNWSKLFSILSSRGCSDPEAINKAHTAAQTLNYNLTKIYQSCLKPVLGAQWIDNYDDLQTSLKTILQDLASYNPRKRVLAQ